MKRMREMPDYRMKWIRIWPHAWFDSSMRVELTNEERAFWVDILACAGKSRIPGVICSNPEEKIGYPLAMLTSLLVSWSQEEVVTILDKLEKTDRVQVIRSPLFSGEEGWIVSITNWQKWQSEAQRIQKYRNTSRSVRRNVPLGTTDSCTTGRIEVEEEVEVDKKKNKKEHSPNGSFSPPTFLELSKYMEEQGFRDPTQKAQAFIDYYETRGWRPGNSRVQMKSWKAAVRTWKQHERTRDEDTSHLEKL